MPDGVLHVCKCLFFYRCHDDMKSVVNAGPLFTLGTSVLDRLKDACAVALERKVHDGGGSPECSGTGARLVAVAGSRGTKGVIHMCVAIHPTRQHKQTLRVDDLCVISHAQ